MRVGIARAAEASDSAESFLLRIVRGMASELESSDYREGCPIATTALETAAQSEVLGNASRNAFQKWELEIKRGLFRFGMPAGDADLAATLVLSQLEGALLLARTYRSLEPLRRAEHALKLLARSGDRNDDKLRAWAPMVPRKGLRTFTAVKPLAPEASASTNSATWARAG